MWRVKRIFGAPVNFFKKRYRRYVKGNLKSPPQCSLVVNNTAHVHDIDKYDACCCSNLNYLYSSCAFAMVAETDSD
jgi:hypothetical protein